MRTFEMYLSGAFGLILVYLLVSNASATNQVLNALSAANTDTIRALQGRR